MKILGISGKAGSGKTTWSNYVLGTYMVNLELTDEFFVSDEGYLLVNKIAGYEVEEAPVAITADELFWEGEESLLSESLAPYVKVYNFAETLKRKICVETLGVERHQCYGNQAEKNTDTRLKVSNFKKFLLPSSRKKFEGADRFLTGREVMEVVGTDIFRQIYNDVWVDACIRKIAYEDPQIAIINDVRFENEVEAIKAVGGDVIRLTRQVESNGHDSDNDLDSYSKFDLVIDNQTCPKEDTASILLPFLQDRGYFQVEVLQEAND